MLCALRVFAAPFSTNGNRLAYLDSDDPFYPGLHFPKLITPQWVGEDGVEAVVILAIDDMRNNEPKYEAMLRPILERLKKIDGRAPVSIMVNTTSPTNAQLQTWLKEGVSLECHTIAHPCPLCQKGDFAAASATYHDCVDLLNTIPGNKPVAFRMPCCDSMNSPTPRFYAEMFNRTSPKQNFLTIDSSVMVILTTNDTSLPRELVVDEQGRERFRKYLPSEINATTRVSMGSFTTTIEDYPYPYVIGKTCWEFPCIVPSDWEASNLHGSTNAATVRDWERALDAIVLKQGVMTFIFHPHGWIKPEQMVQFIDYAVAKYGKRVKFLNFKEAQERLPKLRVQMGDEGIGAGDKRIGMENGVRLLDVENDGHVVAVPLRGFREEERDAVHFGILEGGGLPVAICRTNLYRCSRVAESTYWWSLDKRATLPLEAGNSLVLRDIDRDGLCELVSDAGIYKFSETDRKWIKLPFTLPEGTRLLDDQGRDAGLRFIDVDGDGYDDILFSNSERYSLHLFRQDDRKLRLKPGWSDEIVSGLRGGAGRAATGDASQRDAFHLDLIPPIVRDGTNRNNGVWFARDTMWIQNEDTAHLPDKVDRRTFKQLLSSAQPRAMSPADSLKAMHARPGFKVELVASEPLIESPVAFEWSADGKLWVVEMGDYPLGIDGKGKGGGRVRVLEDTDGDGRYDHATTFLEGLNFPTGVHPWRNGVIVSAAPDIFYAEDTDGDGKANHREPLFSGFKEGNQQHRVNGFSYGLDGWLYGANGDSGGNIRAVGPRTMPGAPQNVSLRGRDLRIQPDKLLFETIAGQTQFGRHRDDFGNWFGNNNPTWLWHYFFPENYLARNPLLPLKTTKKVLAGYAESTRCFPASRTLSRFNDAFAANHVTSACSPTPYRDELFGADFATSVFISEPVHNLVHREVLEPDGVTFTSRRASDEANTEFLASSDNWFRPTMLRTGPDGALYVADMYRLVIEHPEWIPAEMQKRLDLRAGADMGRIYRVYPEGATLRRVPNLTKLSASELVEALDSPNGWQRDTAQRLLIERGDKSVVGKLESFAKSAKSAKVRVQVLWTMGVLGALSEQAIVTALKDESAAVREHAVKLSESGAAGGAIRDRVVALAMDANSRVRYQVAFTLGEWSDARAAAVLVSLARDEDENIRNAAISSASRHAGAMLAMVEKLPSQDRAWPMLPMLRKLVASPPVLATSTTVIERTNLVSAELRAERAQVVARYAGVATLAGDSKNGAALFTQQCAQCHRLRGEGAEVGPDLGIMSGKPVEQVVESILNPNLAMDVRYQAFTVITKDDEESSGVIVSETPTSITLRGPNRVDQIVLRSQIKEMSTARQSLMPEGLESAFTPQQLADLIAYVTGR